MISNILVPTDFSEVANNALRFAVNFSEKANAKIHLLHVTHIPVIDVNFPVDVYQEFTTEIEKTATSNLEKLKKEFLEKSGVKFEIHSVMGFVNDEIMNLLVGIKLTSSSWEQQVQVVFRKY